MNRIELYILLFLVVVFTACNSGGNKTISYGLNQKFTLEESEQEVPSTKERVKIFEFLCTPRDISLPINKIIEAENYGIYISFADSILTYSEYVRLLKQDTISVVLLSRTTQLENKVSNVVMFRKNNIYVSQYWKSAKALGMREVFSLVTKDSLLATTVFNNNEFLQKRLDK